MTAHKPLALTAATIAAAMALAACSGGDSTDPNTIEIGSLYEPVNLSNIAGGGQGVTEALNGNVYEGLFSLADDGTIQPQLATSYDVSEDGLTYTFHLRDGVTFSDGSSFDAADAVHSINRVLAEDSQSARKSQLAVINSVEATDPQTLTVTLSQRSISLPYNLSYLWMVPEGFDSQTETDGTGPYTLDAWTKGSTLALKARDGYWGDAPKNDAVTFHYYTDATAMTNALSAGATLTSSRPCSPRMRWPPSGATRTSWSPKVPPRRRSCLPSTTRRPPSTMRACARPSTRLSTARSCSSPSGATPDR